MNMEEYKKICNMSYDDYCDYLKNKYGRIFGTYFVTDSCSTLNKKIKRGNDGLFIHHIKEVERISLSKKEYAEQAPFEYQYGENLVYCDYLEHLLLHIMICEHPKPIDENETPGITGVIEFLVPTLNDCYCGALPEDSAKTHWKIESFNKIKDDKDVYLELLKRFVKNSTYNNTINDLLTSAKFNYNSEAYPIENNKMIFDEIRKALK